MFVRTPLIRSKKLLRAAKGKPCTLRFQGICNGNPETTVAAHIRDQHKGMGIKASDYSIVFACSSCHTTLDEEGMSSDWESIVRGLQETWGLLIADGIIIVPQDAPAKPKVHIQRRDTPKKEEYKWPKRKIQSRNTLRKGK